MSELRPATVVHGDDAARARPPAELVYWIGPVRPLHGRSTDLWFTGNATEADALAALDRLR